MKNKRNVLYSLAIMLVGVIYFPVQAQQKNGIHRANFSGEWKAKESIGMGGNIVCSYDESDRMLSKTMKIAEQEDFLTIEVPNPSPEAEKATNREKLTFDGKASEIRGKKFKVNRSTDGQTMTVNSIVHAVVPATGSFSVNTQKQAFINGTELGKLTNNGKTISVPVYVTEIWKLSNDGKSIAVQAYAKSTIFGYGRFWKTVFEKAG